MSAWQHCGVMMTVEHDGCIKIVKKCRVCRQRFTQRKRRPAGISVEACSWAVHCDDHPHLTASKRRVQQLSLDLAEQQTLNLRSP